MRSRLPEEWALLWRRKTRLIIIFMYVPLLARVPNMNAPFSTRGVDDDILLFRPSSAAYYDIALLKSQHTDDFLYASSKNHLFHRRFTVLLEHWQEKFSL